MSFTSFNFLIFFPGVLLLFYLTPLKWRWLTLLVASFGFYINLKPVYALLLVWVILITYLFTRLLDKKGVDSRRSTELVSGILLILLPLLFYKYFSVINDSMIRLMSSRHLHWPLPEIKYILPVGISFYTFMAIGYLIDVYNEEIKCERHFGRVALFISFFPLILSGPIERAGHMLPQFREFRRIDYGHVTAGLKLMLWGYFMKLVVADRTGIYVDAVYGDIAGNNGTSLLIASVLYPFQVYADLGGYSLIAIGAARVMGFRVMDNFRRPFFATSMAEFWRRWHISLISWLTDYIYTPLSFYLRRYKLWGIVMALMLTFLISGIWHGAALTFVIWGLMQGLFLSAEALTNKWRTKWELKYNLSKNGLYVFCCIIVTFILFASSQVFARSMDVSAALSVFVKIFTDQARPYIDMTTITYSLTGLSLLMLKDIINEWYKQYLKSFYRFKYASHLKYAILLYIVLLMGVFNSSESFIYFKF